MCVVRWRPVVASKEEMRRGGRKSENSVYGGLFMSNMKPDVCVEFV